MSELEVPVSLFGASRRLVQRRRVWASGAVGGAILLGVFAWVRPAYEAESAFTPVLSDASTGGLSGLAAQLGFNLNSITGGQPLEFYANLVTSRELLAQVAITQFTFPQTIDPAGNGRDTVRASLLELYGATGDSPDERVQDAVKILSRKVAVDQDVRANVVTLNVRARWPALATAVTRRIIDLVNEFNLRSLQSQAGAERRFVEGRLAVAQRDLVSAEDSLERFLDRNRTYQNSPRLMFEEARLQRRVDLRQQVYTTLAQSYEQARISEVRNTPVITVITPPEGSATRVRKPVTMALAGGLVGFLLALAVIALQALVERERQTNAKEYEDFKSALTSWRSGGKRAQVR